MEPHQPWEKLAKLENQGWNVDIGGEMKGMIWEIGSVSSPDRPWTLFEWENATLASFHQKLFLFAIQDAWGEQALHILKLIAQELPRCAKNTWRG